MNRRLAGLAFGWIVCIPVIAQNPDPACDDAPPAPILERDPRQLGPATCSPVLLHKSSPEVISLRSLAHKPSKAAVKEFNRGVLAWRKNELSEALRHMTEAVRLDPGYASAQIELGAFYAQNGQPRLALESLDRALALDPVSGPAYTAKASALVILNEPEAAEPAARRAVQIDPGSVAAHYMLGMALWMQQKFTLETEAHLKIAAEKYPRARPFLADAQARLSEEERAK